MSHVLFENATISIYVRFVLAIVPFNPISRCDRLNEYLDHMIEFLQIEMGWLDRGDQLVPRPEHIDRVRFAQIINGIPL